MVNRLDLVSSLVTVTLAAFVGGPVGGGAAAVKELLGLSKPWLAAKLEERRQYKGIRVAVIKWADTENVADVDAGLQLAAWVTADYGATGDEWVEHEYQADALTELVCQRATVGSYPELAGNATEARVARKAIQVTYQAIYDELIAEEKTLPLLIHLCQEVTAVAEAVGRIGAGEAHFASTVGGVAVASVPEATPFTELIRQGQSLVRRCEKLAGMSYDYVKSLPPEDQVSHIERDEWAAAVTDRVTEILGADAAARVQQAVDLYNQEYDTTDVDEATRLLHYCRRVTILLLEFATDPSPAR